jgi:glyoxylase-like metal-dependent hydrolase (beta-lactamase superfamily II)
MALNDRFVTLYKSGDMNELTLHVHLWLESKSRIDLGDFTLDIIHTPGHTSGSICIYEPDKKFMFTGDTLFAGGILSFIAESGSIGDYINSLQSLETRRINDIYPGHGEASADPEGDIQKAIENAYNLLRQEDNVEVNYMTGNTCS